MDTSGNYIQNQFCNYEIALKLKELGFNEEVIAAFNTEDKVLSVFAFSVPNKGIFEQGFEKGWCIKAPLWQQIIDWFREKHKYSVSIHVDEDNSTPSDIKYWYCIDSFFEVPNNKIVREGIEEVDNFNSYQEAREQAILKAIKLIKK